MKTASFRRTTSFRCCFHITALHIKINALKQMESLHEKESPKDCNNAIYSNFTSCHILPGLGFIKPCETDCIRAKYDKRLPDIAADFRDGHKQCVGILADKKEAVFISISAQNYAGSFVYHVYAHDRVCCKQDRLFV